MSDTIQSFNFSIDLQDVIQWKYSNAPILNKLISNFQDWYDSNHTDFWTNWIKNVFDLRTANEFGLAIWAIILNLPLTNSPGEAPRENMFGFAPFENGYVNFDNGTFGNEEGFSALTINEKRFLLLLANYNNFWKCNRRELNRFLKFLSQFLSSSGTVYVIDNKDMTMTYQFTFNPDIRLISLLKMYDLLPHPAGVGIILKQPNGETL